MKNTQNQKGFTLVELAIVMVIIGLLIGGILKGQELIKNASVTSTAAQLKAFESAYVTFLDIYKGKPGDLGTATTKIPNCNGGNRCANGNSDSYIYYSNSIATGGLANTTGTSGESFQAMKHLALANLIGGVDGSARGGLSNTEAYVKSDLSGYLYMGQSYGNYRSAATGNVALPSGIMIGQTPSLRTWAASANGSSASDLARLDGKVDDGTAAAGLMRLVGNPACFRGRDYRQNADVNQCNFVYKIN